MIFIATGPRGSGKTTFQYQVAESLQQEGFQVKGFLAFHDFQKDSYSIYNLQTHETLPLAQKLSSLKHTEDPFRFDTHALKQGKEWIEDILNELPDLAVIDEIGIYELRGKVWSTMFTRLCNSSVPLFFTAKLKLLPQILKEWELKPTHIFYPEDFQNLKYATGQIRDPLQHS